MNQSRAILIHGCCTKKEFLDESLHPRGHWFPWAKQQLAEREVVVYAPEMPTPYAPSFEEWEQVVSSFEIDENTSLVGHSCGGGFLLRWMQEHRCPIDKLVLVAPWLDPIKNRGNFLTTSIDSTIQDLAREVIIIYSDDDPVAGVKESIEIIRKALPKAELLHIAERGHFTRGEMQTIEFPELLSVLVDE